MRKRQTWPFSAILAILAILIVSPSATMASTTEDVGDVLALLVPLTGIATATLKHDREGQVQFLKSFATNAVITGGLKAAVDKTRPDGECCDSFPSAHSSLSFMGGCIPEQTLWTEIRDPCLRRGVIRRLQPRRHRQAFCRRCRRRGCDRLFILVFFHD